MSGFSITITNNLGEVVERIEGAITLCNDFTPLWERLRLPWERSRKRMYETHGQSTGTPWPGYEQTAEAEHYVWFKAAMTEQRITSPAGLNKLLLRWTKNERLYPSLTNTRSRFAIWKPEKMALAMGSRAPGARNNDEGIGRAPRSMGGHDIPRRPLLTFGRDFTREVGEAVSDYAGEISIALGPRSKVRSGFSTDQVLARIRQARLL